MILSLGELLTVQKIGKRSKLLFYQVFKILKRFCICANFILKHCHILRATLASIKGRPWGLREPYNIFNESSFRGNIDWNKKLVQLCNFIDQFTTAAEQQKRVNIYEKSIR